MDYLDGSFRMLMILMLLILQICPSASWNYYWWSSSSSEIAQKPSRENSNSNSRFPRETIAEFSMEPFTNHMGMKKLEDARNKIVAAPNSCWEKAYNNLFAGCTDALADEESRNRFAWHLTDCFLQHSGRNTLPHCNPKAPVSQCLRAVDQGVVNVYLEYHLETNSICHQLQIQAFRHQTERLVNELKTSV